MAGVLKTAGLLAAGFAAGVVVCLLLNSYRTSVEHDQRQAYQLQQEQLIRQSQDRRISPTAMLLDSGKCLDSARALSPWAAAPGRSEYNLVSVSAPLSSLRLPRRSFTDSEGRAAATVTELQVALRPQMDSDARGWAIASPLRVQMNIRERVMIPDADWLPEDHGGLQLYWLTFGGTRRADTWWNITGSDPRTQCSRAFGMISTLHFVRCDVTDPVRGVSARFDFPTGHPEDIPTIVAATRRLIEQIVDDCPSGSRPAQGARAT